MSRLGSAFTFDDLEVVRVKFGASVVAVVSPTTLYRMKRDTLRPRDHDDAERLRRAFGVGE